MKVADCIGMSTLALVFVLVGCNGCEPDTNQSHKAEDRPKGALSSVFCNVACPYLFMSGRNMGLEDILGSSLPKNFLEKVEHTSDGRMLRIWNYHRTQCYVLEVGQEPRIIDTPAGAYLNRNNQVVLRCEDLGRGEVFFSNGLRMCLPSFVVDADGQYLCVGGKYYDSGAKARKEVPITIRSIDTPEKIVATSRMSGLLEKSVCFQDKLYVFVRHDLPKEQGAMSMDCDVYNRRGGELVFAESMKIKSPLWLSDFVLVADVCPDQAHAILYAHRTLGPRRYLMDMKTQETYDLGSEAIFLDRQVFGRLFENAASRPSEKK